MTFPECTAEVPCDLPMMHWGPPSGWTSQGTPFWMDQPGLDGPAGGTPPSGWTHVTFRECTGEVPCDLPMLHWGPPWMDQPGYPPRMDQPGLDGPARAPPSGWTSWGTPPGWTSQGTPSGWTSQGTPLLDGPAGKDCGKQAVCL